MQTENKIIKYLIETKKEPTIRELAKGIKADYKIVHTAVKRLIDKKLIGEKRVGKSLQLKILNKLSKEVLMVEIERREEMLKNKSLKIMMNSLLQNLNQVNLIILLFGSYANKKADKNSDIDLMFVVPDIKIEKKIDDAVSILPLKIHALVFSEEQFKNMLFSREINVVKEAVKNNIVLYGIEQYYSLIK